VPKEVSIPFTRSLMSPIPSKVVLPSSSFDDALFEELSQGGNSSDTNTVYHLP
jgi:hypothetical protein